MIALATLILLAAVAVVIGGVMLYLRWVAHRSDDEYLDVLLDNANFDTRADHPELQAMAVLMAAKGWDLPDYTEHQILSRLEDTLDLIAGIDDELLEVLADAVG